MDKDTQSEMVQNWKKAFLNGPLTAWGQLISSNAARPWAAPNSIPFSGLSSVMKPQQIVRQCLALNLQQQKSFIDMSSVWLNYLTALAKNQREIRTNGGSAATVLDNLSQAGNDLVTSCISVMDGHMEAVCELYKSSCQEND